MKKLEFDSEFFNAADTLLCGQVFRFTLGSNGYFLKSQDKACKIFTENDKTIIYCKEEDEEYFRTYFDLDTDYGAIYNRAKNSGYEFLSHAADFGKGVRILCQNSEEMLFSFMISQNNNIPRIKSIIEKLCVYCGKKQDFYGESYYAFPSFEDIKKLSLKELKDIGLGYRADYVSGICSAIEGGLIDELKSLNAEKMRERLLKIKGIGEKVADCVCLFGFHKTDSFPADVWVERIYRENFNGEEKSRKKISSYFVSKFGMDSGFFQQYLFYYKRLGEGKKDN